MRVRALALVGATLLSGCSLLLAGDLDAAHEGATTPGGGEAGTSSGSPLSEASTASETSVPDAPAEASSDGGCASYVPAPKFCDDFDRGIELGPGWEYEDNAAGVTTLTTAPFFSSPRAMKVTLDANDGCRYSRGHFDLPDIGSKRLTVTTRVFLAKPWPNGQVPIVVSTYAKNTPSYCNALFYVDTDENGVPNHTSINVQSDVKQNNVVGLRGFPSTDEWAELLVEATPIQPTGLNFRVRWMDPNGHMEESSNDFPECKAFDAATLYVGFHCARGKGTAFYDDLRADWD